MKQGTKREKLIRARIQKGLSQAAAAGLMGVSRNTWSLWELGKEDPYPLHVGALCKFFGVKEPSELDLEPSRLGTENARKNKTTLDTHSVPSQPQVLMQIKEGEAPSHQQEEPYALFSRGIPQDIIETVSEQKLESDEVVKRREILKQVALALGITVVEPLHTSNSEPGEGLTGQAQLLALSDLDLIDNYVEALQRLLLKGEAQYVMQASQDLYTKLMREHQGIKDRRFAETQIRIGMLAGYNQQNNIFGRAHNTYLPQESIVNLEMITQQFREMQRRGDTSLSYGLNTHMIMIQDALMKTPDDTLRRALWSVLARTQLVARFHPVKKERAAQTKTFNELAIASAQNSGDTTLVGAAIGHLAHWYLREAEDCNNAARLLEEAKRYADKDKENVLNGWFSLLAASIAAKKGHKQQCDLYLTEALTIANCVPKARENIDKYYTDFDTISAHVFSINCWMNMGDAKKAQTHLVETDLEQLSDNRRASAYYDASRIYAALGNLDVMQAYAFRAIDKAISTQQFYVIPRCLVLARTLQKKDANDPHTTAIIEYAHSSEQ